MDALDILVKRFLEGLNSLTNFERLLPARIIMDETYQLDMSLAMEINRAKLVSLFSYHPTDDEETKRRYQIVNNSAQDLALALSEIIEDPAELTTILRKLQEVRMLANLAIASKSASVSYKAIYEINNQTDK
jgi:hypothetical protein